MFGERLTALRKSAKMSQTELASKLGVSQTAIYKYEKNQSEPDIQSLLLISDIFGVTLPYLLGREDTLHPPDKTTIDGKIIDLLSDLDPQDLQRVHDFVAGLQAARRP